MARVAPVGNLGRQAGESVEEYVTRLIQTCPPCRADLHLLTKLFNAARYDGVKTAEDEAQSALRAFYAVGNALVARPA